MRTAAMLALSLVLLAVGTETGLAQAVSATTGGAPAPARETVDGCLMTYAYWNPEMLKQKRLLNSQTGKVEAVNITALGEDKITVRGAPVTAPRCSMPMATPGSQRLTTK